jgi:hypothetical protein
MQVFAKSGNTRKSEHWAAVQKKRERRNFSSFLEKRAVNAAFTLGSDAESEH